MKNSRERGRDRRTLTFFFFIVILAVLTVTLVLVAGLTSLFLHFDILHAAQYSRDNLIRMTFFMALACLLVGAGLSGLSLRFIMGPVNRLTEGLNALARGQFETRIAPAQRGPDVRIQQIRQIRDLLDAFNKLAEELEHTDIMRTDFINDFSHEFKTPIVSIACFAKILRRDSLPEERRREYLSIIEEESLRLSAMATNVLNLTRVENQTILRDVTDYNLSEQIRTCLLMLEERWEAKNLTPDLQLEEICLQGSEKLLREVWLNLLDNAVKFADPGSTLTVRAESAEDAVRVQILNEGPAIPQESMQRIFHKFYQADASRSTRGNGLGLAIVHRIVELHGGSVTAACENGTTAFTVILPR